MNPEHFSVNLSINSGIYKENSANYLKIIESLPKNTFSFLFVDDTKILEHIPSELPLKLIPTYSVLYNNSIFPEHPEIAQIDHLGNPIFPYFCPNNPKLESIIRTTFDSLIKSPQTAGIQLQGLEMPPTSSNVGCFCPYCSSIAEEKGIDLTKISAKIKDSGEERLNQKWIQKKFPDWLKFRMESISNLAGKTMVMIRRLNPDLFLGLNINYSETPEFVGQDYFFLALYLDMLNFIVNIPSNMIRKKLLKQIRSVTKKFLGEIKLFMQMKVPNAFNLDKAKMTLTNTKKYSFDGLIFDISAVNELEKIMSIRFSG